MDTHPSLLHAKVQKVKQVPHIAVLCAGLDRVNRGYESHVRMLVDHLRSDPPVNMEVTLFKGDGACTRNDVAISTPKRDGRLCKFLARLRGDELYWEYLLFALAFVVRSVVLRIRFGTVSCIEPMVAKTVHRLKWLLPGKPRITFTHGVCMPPENYWNIGDCIHEVNVENYERMRAHLARNRLEKEVVCIPHFLPCEDAHGNKSVPSRESLGICTTHVVVAVGVIDSDHKRTDHVIREIAQLGPDWTLLACGTPEGSDGQRVVALGRELLGSRFVNICLPRTEVWKAYAVGDFFVLGSLNEGFGLVILEAMRAGLPVVAHDRTLFRWILGEPEACVRMDISGALSEKLRALSEDREGAAAAGARLRSTFVSRFTWKKVRDDYAAMLVSGPLP